MGRAIVAIALVAGTTRAHAECKPAAIPQGDPALVQSLLARLTANGVATTRSSGCPTIDVRIEQRGQQVHLKLTDAFQRTGERDVQDLATAAALVESWTQQVIEEGSLPPELTATSAPPAIAIAEPLPLVRSGIAIGVSPSLGSNGSTWLGGAVSACMGFGPTCTGIALRAAADTTATGDSSTLSEDNYELDALATTDVPLRLGGFVVSPGLAAGYGYAALTVHHMDAHGNPLDVVTADHQLRAGGHVTIARSFADHFAWFADLAGDGALVRSDSSSGPAASVRISLGLRLEAR